MRKYELSGIRQVWKEGCGGGANNRSLWAGRSMIPRLLTLVQLWASVADAGPVLSQRRADVCLYKLTKEKTAGHLCLYARVAKKHKCSAPMENTKSIGSTLTVRVTFAIIPLQEQTTVAAEFSSEQLLLFAFATGIDKTT